VSFRDTQFPLDLATIPEAPPILFYRGDVSMLHRRGIAIVGTRNATARGCDFARDLGAELSRRSIAVTSGVARGIDTAAHAGALEHPGSTVGVLGTGLDVAFPQSNRDLMESIATRGCLVTEQLMGTTAQPFVFPRRNRLISGLSHAVVVIEAASRSGALITARWALEQGRDVGAVPGFPGEPRSRGANHLIKQGAFAVENVDDILEAVPLLGRYVEQRRQQGSVGVSPDTSDLSADAQSVLQAVGADATDVDTIARHSGQGAAIVQRVLLDLEIRGVVARDRSGFYYTVRAGES
jgi:DNA processing protein